MGPWLFSSLVALVCVSLLALFFPMGSGMQLLLAFFGAVLFSACACCASMRASACCAGMRRVRACPPSLSLLQLASGADIVYDTFEIIKRYSVDEYVWASVGLYLDILNLFLRLLEILGMARND